MPPLLRLSAVLIAVVALAPPAVADPVDPIPGSGVFVVGPDIAPGLYHTAGSGSAFGVWINNVPTQDSMCSWFTYSTPDQYGGQGLRVAQLPGLDAGSPNRFNYVQPQQN